MTYLNNDDPNHEPAYIPPPHNDLEDGFLRITIIHLDRNRKDPLYKFDATTNLLRYKRSIFKSVERTYSEFERLHNHLSIVDEECLVPALPLFTTSAATPEEDERRARANMQRWFERITIHPRLSKDDELREFIQSDFGFLPQTKPRPARRPVGTLRMLTANLGLAAPVTVNDTDEQFVEFAEQVDEVTDCIAVAGRAVEKEVKARKALATSYIDLAARTHSLGTVETHPGLANAFRKLGRTLQAFSEMQKAQAATESTVIGDVLGYQQRNMRCVKEALENRREALQDLEEASRDTEARLRYMERLKASIAIVPERVDDALEDLQDAKAQEQAAAHRYHKMTTHLRTDLETFGQDTATDLLAALREYAREQARAELAQLREWERLRPDFSAITRRQMSIHVGEVAALDVRGNGTAAEAKTKEELKDWQFARNLGRA